MSGNLMGYTENVERQEKKHTPLPAGVYTVEIIEAEVKPSSNGNPTLYCTYVVDAPEGHKNRKVWDNFSLSHDVGKARLLDMAIACGHPNPRKLSDSDEILHKTMKIKTKIETKEGFEPRTRVSYYIDPTDKKDEPKAEQKPANKKPW